MNEHDNVIQFALSAADIDLLLNALGCVDGPVEVLYARLVAAKDLLTTLKFD